MQMEIKAWCTVTDIKPSISSKTACTATWKSETLDVILYETPSWMQQHDSELCTSSMENQHSFGTVWWLWNSLYKNMNTFCQPREAQLNLKAKSYKDEWIKMEQELGTMCLLSFIDLSFYMTKWTENFHLFPEEAFNLCNLLSSTKCIPLQ